ncbi:Neprilysin-2-like 2 [Homarus americanus]|uniref:Neprilysin-2-like 2 n=1 Tax=Homarus americanus TaxID=6706 RepID=A0A8J5MSM7_HOMAM|nr:Neprilysin-2-like 2 [Homarus americanus]
MSNMYLHYIGNTTVTNIRTHAASMLELLREEVEVSIRSSEWMSKKDKVVALEKLNLLQAEVGAYDRHWNISYVNESHSESLPTKTQPYHILVVLTSWAFTVQPFIVNAFHMQSTNTIVFPEAFFQPPYYLTRGPEYMNYGSAATAMAHEIFHGMDFTGDDKTRQKLNETADCYHNLLAHAFYEVVLVQYTMIAMDIDSSATLNENLADIAGIRHAYRAYQRWVERHYVEPRLPALPLSPEQLFFVSAAQPYCAVIPALAKIFLMELDEHLPNNMRINAVMMNTPEFAQVFNCSQDSRMVAHETCHIF